MLAAALGAFAAGCGSSSKSSSSSSSGVSSRGLPTCASLSAGDLSKVGGPTVSRVLPLARIHGSKVRCASVFVDTSGGIIVEIEETPGDVVALKKLRRATAKDVGTKAVHSLPSLSPGAFFSSRVIGFIRGDVLVMLQADYSTQGKLELTETQLQQLAKIAAAHR